MPVLKMSQPVSEVGIPLLTTAVSNDDIRKQASKLGYENDRLKRVLDTQITSVESLMHSNTHLRAERERFTKELTKYKHEISMLEQEYEKVLVKHDTLTESYRAKLNLMEVSLQEANGQTYAAKVIIDRQNTKMLEKDIYIRELVEQQRVLKKQLSAQQKKAPVKQADVASKTVANTATGDVNGVVKAFVNTLSQLTMRDYSLPKLKLSMPVFSNEEKQLVQIEAKKLVSLGVPGEMLKNKFDSLASELKARADKRKIEALKKRRSKLWNNNQAAGVVSAWKKIDVVDFTNVAEN
ncbi:hypothetical protein [Saccharophagus degradans]|uniref:Uncharacterized protein n=1 Tax=Saccharophagus degradans (strain 2-40 / ATCC 43961 / DSM 17024) TaxID=203122 RepID=Q21KF5_SACD2|nr:hypothetical protein [Saccharophagus degradans]ABD80824.1 hypothetical protein Sde_1562 [Saccharophagus degradans 2-40]